MDYIKFIVIGLSAILIAGCDSGLKIQKGEESGFLFSLKSAQTLGDQAGNVALQANGIHLHPGANTPTSVTFNLDGKIKSLSYKPFIGKLDEEGQKHPEAGIVGFEIFVDGKSTGKNVVDRNTNIENTLELKGAKSLEFRVDNGNGTVVWDWFFVKVTSIK